MKKLVLFATFALSTVAAHAEYTQTPAEFANELRNLNTTGSAGNKGWDLGFIEGVAYADPKVCSEGISVFTFGNQLADGIDAVTDLPAHLTMDQEKALIMTVMEKVYACK